MKQILAILLLIMIVNCKAQQPVLRTLTFEESFDENYFYKKGDYVKDTQNQLDPYVGIWKYQGTEKTLILKIQKVTMFYENIGKTYIDVLIITYKYVKNGVVVVDNLDIPVINNFDNTAVTNRKKYGTFSLNKYNNELFLSGSITDIPLNILTNTDIYPIDFNIIGVTPKIKIQYNGLMSYRGNPASFYVGKPTFELPNNVVLVKQ
ncbi:MULTISPECIES: DUF6705 family protein [Chryseobacterium]|uniref:DUF6705 domain-containing protein n=1 Tax=Chryseobacterium taihuense TaxID=1141221 RepID=A0A4V6IDD5_9FLAO|nr:MULTISPECIES: DUF6705 family protein [Chryseobacterium]QQV03648.1 hypothetical protein I6I61_04740 [Chryseobacterium sp. FDAARGOS 1104]VFB03014.1 Uncharacterised protein [Chryseobacterium taihuense]